MSPEDKQQFLQIYEKVLQEYIIDFLNKNLCFETIEETSYGTTQKYLKVYVGKKCIYVADI